MQFDHSARADDEARPGLMTYHDPDAWPPPHMPRHAMPTHHRRRRPRQSPAPGLRGAIPWAIGLCSVVAAVMVVAALSPPARTGRTDEDSVRQSPAGQPNSPSPASGSGAARSAPPAADTQPGMALLGSNAAGHDGAAWHWEVMAGFSGTGDVTTATFRVRQQADLHLRWSFRCPSGTEAGALEIQDVDAATRSVDGSIEDTGTAGRGTVVIYPGGAHKFLVVTSGCSWTVRAVQRS